MVYGISLIKSVPERFNTGLVVNTLSDTVFVKKNEDQISPVSTISSGTFSSGSHPLHQSELAHSPAYPRPP